MVNHHSPLGARMGVMVAAVLSSCGDVGPHCGRRDSSWMGWSHVVMVVAVRVNLLVNNH
jgi:hypothetical protein